MVSTQTETSLIFKPSVVGWCGLPVKISVSSLKLFEGGWCAGEGGFGLSRLKTTFFSPVCPCLPCREEFSDDKRLLSKLPCGENRGSLLDGVTSGFCCVKESESERVLHWLLWPREVSLSCLWTEEVEETRDLPQHASVLAGNGDLWRCHRRKSGCKLFSRNVMNIWASQWNIYQPWDRWDRNLWSALGGGGGGSGELEWGKGRPFCDDWSWHLRAFWK